MSRLQRINPTSLRRIWTEYADCLSELIEAANSAEENLEQAVCFGADRILDCDPEVGLQIATAYLETQGAASRARLMMTVNGIVRSYRVIPDDD